MRRPGPAKGSQWSEADSPLHQGAVFCGILDTLRGVRAQQQPRGPRPDSPASCPQRSHQLTASLNWADLGHCPSPTWMPPSSQAWVNLPTEMPEPPPPGRGSRAGLRAPNRGWQPQPTTLSGSAFSRPLPAKPGCKPQPAASCPPGARCLPTAAALLSTVASGSPDALPSKDRMPALHRPHPQCSQQAFPPNVCFKPK